MIDKTTEGYAATPEDIEGMLRNLCAYALSEPDPLQRYVDLTHQQVLFDGVVAAIRRERGKALAEMMTMGAPIAKVAEVTNLEAPQKVKSLITGAGLPVPTQKPARRAAQKKAPAVSAPRRAPESDVPNETADRRQDAGTDDPWPVAVAESGPLRQRERSAPPPPVPVLPQDAVQAKRTLTPAERAALGLPASGPIPQTFHRHATGPVRSR